MGPQEGPRTPEEQEGGGRGRGGGGGSTAGSWDTSHPPPIVHPSYSCSHLRSTRDACHAIGITLTLYNVEEIKHCKILSIYAKKLVILVTTFDSQKEQLVLSKQVCFG